MISLLKPCILMVRRTIMNKKIWAVVSREFLTRAKTKGYIIGTLMFPVILIFLFGGIFIFGRFFQPSTQHFEVIDQTGKIFPQMVEMLSDTLKNGSLKYSFTEIDATEENLENTLEELRTKVLQKVIDGFFIIPDNILTSRQVKYSARNVSNFDDLRDIERVISKSVGNIRLENLGYSPEVIRQEMYAGYISLTSYQVTEKGEISKSGVSNFLLTYLLTYLLMLFIMIYGQAVTGSVIEEKSQRITETIISSIKPIELMMGKIVGICLLGITQLTVIGSFIISIYLSSVSFCRLAILSAKTSLSLRSSCALRYSSCASISPIKIIGNPSSLTISNRVSLPIAVAGIPKLARTTAQCIRLQIPILALLAIRMYSSRVDGKRISMADDYEDRS